MSSKNWLGDLRNIKDRVESSPTAYRLASGAFWSLTGSVVARGLSLLSAIVVARILGTHDFGQLGMIQSTVGMFGVLAGFGMGMTATKHVAQFRRQDPARAGRIIGLSSLVSWITGGAMTFVLFIFAPWISSHTLAAPEMAEQLRLGALLILFGGVNGAQIGALSGFEAFRSVARINLVSGLCSFPVTLAGAWLFGLHGAVMAAVASVGISCALNYATLRKETARAGVPLGYRHCGQEWRLLWQFSLPAVLSGASVVPMHWAVYALLANQPGGYADLGVFNAANRIKQLPETLYSMVAAPMVPVLSERFSENDSRRYHKTFLVSLYLSVLIIVPIALLQAAVPWLTLAPYGSDYVGHFGTVRWLMLHALIVGILIPVGNVLISMGRMWLALIFQVVLGTGHLVFGWFLVPRHGVEGLAAALALAQLASSLPCIVYIYSLGRGFFRPRPQIELALWGALLFAACVAADHLARPSVAIGIGVFSASALVVLVFRGMRREHLFLA